MQANAQELARLMRRMMASQDRDAGSNTVPQTLGNQAIPYSDSADGEVSGRIEQGRSDTYADRDDRGPAYRGAPNDMAWRDQNRLSMGGYRERVEFAPADKDGAIVTLDPGRAATWWIDCAGSVTIQIADAEPVQGVDEYAPAAQQAELITIFVVRNKDKSITWPSDWKWSVEVRGGAIGSDNPFAAASADAQIDAFTVVRIPNRGTFAFVSGRKFA
ncbi:MULTISPECIES: hypothetical protein [Methylobacterium]|uniref:hypothetical protein n=1 Tax=Methylobacterium TaxID=407 RepID=UPI00272DF9EB|nr:hypothetical protein [Methylobacterium sp.]